jgi:hypothetical protein
MSKRIFEVVYEIPHTIIYEKTQHPLTGRLEIRVSVDGKSVYAQTYTFFDLAVQQKHVFYIEDRECAVVTNYAFGLGTIQVYIDKKPIF